MNLAIRQQLWKKNWELTIQSFICPTPLPLSCLELKRRRNPDFPRSSWNLSPHPAHQQLPKWSEDNSFGAGCIASMTTSWLGQFPPTNQHLQIEFFARLKREEEKTHSRVLIRACAHWTSLYQNRTQDGVPQQSFGDPRGEQRESKVVTVLFFSLPTEDQFSLQWTKACRIKICLILKGIREDTYLIFSFQPESMHVCPFQVN